MPKREVLAWVFVFGGISALELLRVVANQVWAVCDHSGIRTALYCTSPEPVITGKIVQAFFSTFICANPCRRMASKCLEFSVTEIEAFRVDKVTEPGAVISRFVLVAIWSHKMGFGRLRTNCSIEVSSADGAVICIKTVFGTDTCTDWVLWSVHVDWGYNKLYSQELDSHTYDSASRDTFIVKNLEVGAD